MTASTYLNQRGIAKVIHDPCFTISGNYHRYAIHLFPDSMWDPIRVNTCFPDREAAEAHLAAVFPLMKLVPDKRFDALVANFAILPRNFSNCH